jgi:hypothetical protein
VRKVFICYRRQDSIATAGRIHDRMAREFGDSNTIMDVDSIPVGRDFEAYLDKSVSRCDIFLAIIGLNWLTTLHATHDDREKDGIDYVATEIVAALNRDIPVVPVLVDGAAMPSADELPDSLRPLARRNAIEVRNTQFHSDGDRLVEKIREVIPKSFWKDHKILALIVGAIVVLALFLPSLVVDIKRLTLKALQERSTLHYSTTCHFTSGPRKGETQYYQPGTPGLIPAIVGTPCTDGAGSDGYAVAD